MNPSKKQKKIETELLLEEVEKLMQRGGGHKKPNASLIETKNPLS